MKTRILVAAAAAASWSLMSCGPRATPEECAGACRNYVNLLQVVEGDRKTAALEAIDREMKLLEKALERELETLDQEVERKLDLALDDDERTAVIEEYEDRSEAKQEEYQPRFEALMEAKALGAGAANVEKALEGCIDRCLEGRTAKGAADCQVNAVDLAGFHMCK